MDSSTLAKLKEQYKKDVKRKKNQKRKRKPRYRAVTRTLIGGRGGGGEACLFIYSCSCPTDFFST